MRKNKLLIALALLALFCAGGYLGYVQYYLPQKFRKLTDKIDVYKRQATYIS